MTIGIKKIWHDENGIHIEYISETDFFAAAIDEPKPICRHCEYFDGGGLGEDGVPIRFLGDCLNNRSPGLETNQDKSCSQFFPCSTRWPDADHD